MKSRIAVPAFAVTVFSLFAIGASAQRFPHRLLIPTPTVSQDQSTTGTSSQPTVAWQEQLLKDKYGRYSPIEEARQQIEQANANLVPQTTPQAPPTLEAQVLTNTHREQWLHAKYGRYSPLEENAERLASDQTFAGVITDSNCGKVHMAMNGTPASKCVLMCKGHGGKFALYDGNAVFVLSDQKTPRKFAGENVKVLGALDQKTQVLTADSITPEAQPAPAPAGYSEGGGADR